jgi:hypothetical protein
MHAPTCIVWAGLTPFLACKRNEASAGGAVYCRGAEEAVLHNWGTPFVFKTLRGLTLHRLNLYKSESPVLKVASFIPPPFRGSASVSRLQTQWFVAWKSRWNQQQRAATSAYCHHADIM